MILSNRNMKPMKLVSCFVRSFSSQKDEALKKRREELMKRGLPQRKSIPGVKNVILVSSGKGGVGKSTVAVNLAIALSNLDKTKKVSLLDADIFGPSIPIMMNLAESPLLDDHDKMIPLTNYGVHCMSMGLLVKPESAVVWRGPMVMGALNKLLFSTNWADTDYLIVDTPPGTGDIHLSLAQTVTLSGAVLVSTPQRVALADVRKGADMYSKMQVEVLGLVQNMSSFVCGHCGETTHMFGQDGARRMAESLGVPLLGDIPLDPNIMTGADSGVPVMVSHPHSVAARAYLDIAGKIYHC